MADGYQGWIQLRRLSRKFLGFTISRNEPKLKVADPAIEKLNARAS
jgi:hypothetical protein